MSAIQAVTDSLAKYQGNKHLNGIISICPTDIALRTAHELDEERSAGKVRSELHGVPIVVKDAIVTGVELGMPTTAGAEVFRHMKAKRNAAIVDRLVNAGLNIVGKANLTEFCGLKDAKTPVGYSTVGGQTLSPFRRKDLAEEDQPTPGGSSSGPAVCVATHISPYAISTETGGSNVYPASCNGVYALSLTTGSLPTDGVFRISESFDRIGVMGRDVEGLRALRRILKGDTVSAQDGQQKRKMRVGVANVEWGIGKEVEGNRKWTLDETRSRYQEMVDRIKGFASQVIYPVDMPDPSDLICQGQNLYTIALYEHPTVLKKFLEVFEPNEDVHDLASLIKWNEENKDIAMPAHHPGQSSLIDSLNSTMTTALHDETLHQLRRIAREAMEGVLQQHDLDVIIANSDSQLVSYAAILGWPIGTFPVGVLGRNGQRWGGFVLGRGEEEILRFMMAWEAVIGKCS